MKIERNPEDTYTITVSMDEIGILYAAMIDLAGQRDGKDIALASRHLHPIAFQMLVALQKVPES